MVTSGLLVDGNIDRSVLKLGEHPAGVVEALSAVCISPAMYVDPRFQLWIREAILPRLSNRGRVEIIIRADVRSAEELPPADVPELQLESLEYHACSSGTATPPMVRGQILAACLEVRKLRAALEERDRVIADLYSTSNA